MSFHLSVIVFGSLVGFANKIVVPLQKHNLHVHAWVYIIINNEKQKRCREVVSLSEDLGDDGRVFYEPCHHQLPGQLLAGVSEVSQGWSH